MCSRMQWQWPDAGIILVYYKVIRPLRKQTGLDPLVNTNGQSGHSTYYNVVFPTEG